MRKTTRPAARTPAYETLLSLPVCLYRNNGASRDDITTAIATLEELYRRITRIYGATHPQTRGTQDYLEKARETLARAK